MNPYAVLGVATDATDEQIQAAYRRGARTHHPDRNPGDADAPRRFAELGKAVAWLRDPKRRAFYDRYGNDPVELGIEGAALDAALRPEPPKEKPSRDQCPKCHGTGWRSSGRSCTFCDPDALNKPAEMPDWDPLVSTSIGRKDVAAKETSRPRRMRLKPAKKKYRS